MRSVLCRVLVLAAGASFSAGCASHRTPSPADRFILHKKAKLAAEKSDAPPSPSLEEAIGKVRQLMATARPAPRSELKTLEMSDPVLAAALKALAGAETVENVLRVGEAYHRRALLDQAYLYYSRALKLDKRSADAHEAMARLWRDWGLPHLGLTDAHRAIYYAPASGAAQNTLGTVLQALGQRAEARKAYKMAFFFDGRAGYAFNNLCYLSLLEGNASQALNECRVALNLDPSLTAARNNIALTYAALGMTDRARLEFVEAGGAARGAYNIGIVYLAQRRYRDAAEEFDMARAEPMLADAERRARNARLSAARTDKP